MVFHRAGDVVFFVEGVGYEAYGSFGDDLFDEDNTSFPLPVFRPFHVESEVNFFKMDVEGYFDPKYAGV